MKYLGVFLPGFKSNGLEWWVRAVEHTVFARVDASAEVTRWISGRVWGTSGGGIAHQLASIAAMT